MQEPTDTGHTAQSDRIIETVDRAQPVFFSEKVGRDYGSPLGGWSAERDQATRMTEEKAQELLAGPLATFAPNAKVVMA